MVLITYDYECMVFTMILKLQKSMKSQPVNKTQKNTLFLVTFQIHGGPMGVGRLLALIMASLCLADPVGPVMRQAILKIGENSMVLSSF